MGTSQLSVSTGTVEASLGKRPCLFLRRSLCVPPKHRDPVLFAPSFVQQSHLSRSEPPCCCKWKMPPCPPGSFPAGAESSRATEEAGEKTSGKRPPSFPVPTFSATEASNRLPCTLGPGLETYPRASHTWMLCVRFGLILNCRVNALQSFGAGLYDLF